VQNCILISDCAFICRPSFCEAGRDGALALAGFPTYSALNKYRTGVQPFH